MPGRLFDQPKYLLHPAAPVPSCPNTVARWGKGGGVDVGGRGSQRSGLSSKRSIPMVQLSYLSHRMDNSVAMRRDEKGWEGKREGGRGKGREGSRGSSAFRNCFQGQNQLWTHTGAHYPGQDSLFSQVSTYRLEDGVEKMETPSPCMSDRRTGT